MAAVNLKQRIIGAIVLLALAVIFLPMFLQESQGPKLKVTQIPDEPAKPAVSTKMNLPKVTPPAPASTPTSTPAPATSTPTPAAPVMKNAWALQLGTFANLANAEKLLKQLRAQYPAYAVKTTVNNKPVVKIFVGPQLKKSVLEQQAQDLEKRYKLKSKLIAYDPNTIAVKGLQ